MKKLKPLMIFPDPNATHLFPRWWHKFIFWKKFVYPDFKIRAKRMTMKEFLNE